MDETHAAHICRQLIDLVKSTITNSQRSITIIFLSEIQKQKIIRLSCGEFMFFDINPSYPITFSFQFLYQMSTDKTTRPTY